ncbi:uncharacterized protein LOC114458738 [Gouania willdenowi]|uniref:uncharacterized protein LOC114458738 n=1 Tax=Gouania willdenowi TaxID=441366 RepID=UPI0010544B70|nr:uncharacterized protein LOC114458738 [Gouania willdenowi]
MHSRPETEHVDIVTSLSELINARSDSLAMALEGLKKTLDFVSEEVRDVKGRVTKLEVRVTKEEGRGEACQYRVTEVERYLRRWNLRLFGVKESEREDPRKAVIEICQSVLPESKDCLPYTVDTVHRIGPRRQNDNRPRAIIIQFTSRFFRDSIWRAAKSSTFLKERHLKFAEDLSKEDRERRSKLWPTIDKARKEGKKAYFVGSRGFIEGSEISLTST